MTLAPFDLVDGSEFPFESWSAKPFERLNSIRYLPVSQDTLGIIMITI